MLKRELGNSARVATIGSAGESLVAFANVVCDNDSSASCGMGAVMGSKNLKAAMTTKRGQGHLPGREGRCGQVNRDSYQ